MCVLCVHSFVGEQSPVESHQRYYRGTTLDFTLFVEASMARQPWQGRSRGLGDPEFSHFGNLAAEESQFADFDMTQQGEIFANTLVQPGLRPTVSAEETRTPYTSCRVAAFVTKAFEIFSDGQHEALCGWGRDGKTIVIRRIAEFETKVRIASCRLSSLSPTTCV